MTTWVLILYAASRTVLAIATVPDYISQVECDAAGKAYVLVAPADLVHWYACIPGPDKFGPR